MPLLRRISRTARSDSRARLGPPGRRRRRERDVLRQDTACRSSCSISWHTDTWGRRGARWSLPATSLPPPLAAPFPSDPLGNLHTLLLSPPHLCVHLSFSFLQALSPPLFLPPFPHFPFSSLTIPLFPRALPVSSLHLSTPVSPPLLAPVSILLWICSYICPSPPIHAPLFLLLPLAFSLESF